MPHGGDWGPSGERDPSGEAEPGARTQAGLVLLAYDGSELAALAIERAGGELAPCRDALVVCVWQPADVGFVPAGGRSLRAAQASEVRAAAEETAAQGALLAERAGFKARSWAVEAAPTWSGIVAVAQERQASVIVLGSHRRSGLKRLLGSVAAAVVSHADCPVLVVRQRP